MSEQYYDVTVTRQDDPHRAASFKIEPAVQFVTEDGLSKLTDVVRRLILERMWKDDDEDLNIAITHNLPDNSATIGRARFEGLAFATGVVVLQQALELGLNGTDAHISPASPLRYPDPRDLS